MSEFDAYADDYRAELGRGISASGHDAEFFAQGRIRWLAHCLRRIPLTAESVLDYGCGTGTATAFFFDLLGAQSMIGVDTSARSLDIARQGCTNETAVFRMVDEYRPDASVQVAYCNGVLHHIPPDERLQAVEYIVDAIRPGGVFALWENNPWSPAARWVMSKIPFDRDAIMVWPGEARHLARTAGLRVLRTDYCFILPRFLSAFRPVEPYLSRLPFGAQFQVLAQKPIRP